MSYFKKIFQNKIKVAGAGGKKGAKPAYMMPPDGSFTKIGYQLYEALDIISEGPIKGLVDQRGIILNSAKDIDTERCISVGTDTDSLGLGSFTSTSSNESYIHAPFTRIDGEKEIEVSFVCTNIVGNNFFDLTNDSGSGLEAGATSEGNQSIVLGKNTFTFTIPDGGFALALTFSNSGVPGSYELDVEEIILRDANTENRATKNYSSSDNIIGSSTNGIDKGVYFDDTPLRDERNSPNLAKYDVSLRLGGEFQEAPLIGASPERIVKVSTPLKGRYSMGSTVDTVSLTSITGTFESNIDEVLGGIGGNLGAFLKLILLAKALKTSFAIFCELEIECESAVLKNLHPGLGITIEVDGTSESRINGQSFTVSKIEGIGSAYGDDNVRITAVGSIDSRKNIGGILTSAIEPFSASGGNGVVKEGAADNGSRKGTGSKDIRREGTSARDFVNWQNFVPVESNPKPYLYTNYDSNITRININLQIDALQDTKSFSTKKENDAGKSKMGTPLPLSVTFLILTGKIDKNGVKTEEFATFTTRAKNSVSLGNGNGQVKVTGIISSPYVISLENINLPTLSNDDLYNYVEVTKLEYETISNLVKREAGVNSIVEKGDEVFLYPNSATIATSIDSKYYPSVPTRTFRTKGKKVLIPSNYHPIEENGIDRRFSDDGSTKGNIIYSGAWDGTFKFDWTDNPAWIYYDLLINTRYGIGAKLRDTDIVDKWSLYEIGMYCDAVTMNDGSRTTNASGVGAFLGLDDGFGGLEPRFSCNLHIKDQKDAIEMLQELSNTFRAITFYNNSSVGVRVDRPHFFEDFNRTTSFENSLPDGSFVPPKELKLSPHLMFNNLNVVNGEFSYTDSDRSQKLSAVEVTFLDKRSNFLPKTEYVEDPESVKKFGLNVKQSPGLGVTSRGQAHRMAKYMLFESANTTETVSFNVGFEALLLQPGDIIQIDDEMRNFSKNFGTVLKTSGEAIYFDPDATGTGDFQTGLGPASIIIEPSINSNEIDLITGGGNIHIYNGIGRSGIDEFYKNPSSENSLYQKINNPQMISLKMITGGSGLTYDILDEGIAIHIDVTGTFKSGASDHINKPSQWFSEISANIIPESRYSIDISGREQKYYRVMNVSENNDFGYNVIGVIHHTGKYKFVEENLQFDLDEDTFQPDLKLTDVTRPNAPASVATGDFSDNLDGSKNLPITITHGSSPAGERFVVFLEEPNGNQVISQFNKSSSATTVVTLSGAAKIDQIGDYAINVFSENTIPVLARSNNAATVSFTTDADDFGLDAATDSFIEYQDISILTDFTGSGYDNTNETGFANISFAEDDPNIIATYNMAFEDIFQNSGNEVLQSVSEQIINLYNSEGDLKSGEFKTLTNENTFTVTKTQIDEAFGYTGDGRYIAPTGLKFQGNFFTLSGSADLGVDGQFIQFESDTEFYDEAPMVFIQQVTDGSITGKQKPIGRVRTTRSGFFVTGVSTTETDYYYFASPTGVFKLENNSKTIEVGKFNKNQSSSFIEVTFNETFASNPKVLTQLQKKDEDTQNFFATTNITGTSTTKFDMNAYDENVEAFNGNETFAYIATDIDSFNILLNNNLPQNTINIATSGASSISPTGETILEEYNGAAYKYDHDNQMLFAQKTGTNYSGEFMVIHRTGSQNKAVNYPMITGDYDMSGVRFRDFSDRNPDHGYSLFNLNGDRDQYVVDVVDVDTNTTGSYTATDLEDGTLLADIGTDGVVSKLYDQFGGKHASGQSGSHNTGYMPYIVTGGQFITLDSKPAMIFRSGSRNAFLDIKTEGFTNSEPSDLSTHISGVDGIEAFATVSLDANAVASSSNTAYNNSYIFGENYNGGKKDYGLGFNLISSNNRLILYTERGDQNAFARGSVAGDTDATKHGYAYTGEIVTLGEKYTINSFSKFDEDNGSGIVGLGTGQNYASGYVVTGRDNYIVGSIGSDESFDKTFKGRFQEVLFYTSLRGDRNDIYNDIQNRLAQDLDHTAFNKNFINVKRTGVTPEYSDDITLVGWFKFSSDLTGKQYLMEYSNGNTGIAWFQSGDGKNYINTNGVDYKVIDTNINDGNLHMLQIAIDRDQFAYGYLDGAIDFTGYHNLYTGTMGFNNSDAAVDAESDQNFVELETPITLPGEFDISFSTILTGYKSDNSVANLSGAHFLAYNLGTNSADKDRFFHWNDNGTLKIRFNVNNQSDDFANVAINLNQKHDIKITRDSSHDIRLFIDGSQHPTTHSAAGDFSFNSFGGPWGDTNTEVPSLNGTMFDISVKSGSSLTEIYKAGGYGTGAESWRSVINGYEYTATISGVPLSTDIALTGDNDGYEDIYPDKTQIKLLGNSSTLTGQSLTQGHAFNSLAFITGELVTADYTNTPESFFTTYDGDANTDFIVAFTGAGFEDASNNYDTIEIVGKIEKGVNRSALHDFDFIQIGNTGTT